MLQLYLSAYQRSEKAKRRRETHRGWPAQAYRPGFEAPLSLQVTPPTAQRALRVEQRRVEAVEPERARSRVEGE